MDSERECHSCPNWGLAGATVVVIGGTSGIGKAVAKLTAQHGGHTVVVGRSASRLAAARQEFGDTVVVKRVDMADDNALRAFFAGFDRIDHLVVTAGEFRLASIRDTDYEAVRALVEERFRGTYNSVRFAAPLMPSTGSITLFSGILAIRPVVGAAAVAGGVAAIEAFTRVAALELAPIRVNAVAPGLVDTPMLNEFPSRDAFVRNAASRLPVRRIGEPDDIAQTVLYLMSNRFTTGTIVRVDGGALLV